MERAASRAGSGSDGGTRGGEGKEVKVGAGARGLERALGIEECDFGADFSAVDERGGRIDAFFDHGATAKEARDTAEELALQLAVASAAAWHLEHPRAERLEMGPRGVGVDGACRFAGEEEARGAHPAGGGGGTQDSAES